MRCFCSAGVYVEKGIGAANFADAVTVTGTADVELTRAAAHSGPLGRALSRDSPGAGGDPEALDYGEWEGEVA
jgi:hypothetical protein